MTLTDCINSVPYRESASKNTLRLDDLVEGLEKMGIKLQADEKSVFLNFCSESMSELASVDEIIKVAQSSGIRTS